MCRLGQRLHYYDYRTSAECDKFIDLFIEVRTQFSEEQNPHSMLPQINEVFSKLSTRLSENNTKFSCGPKFTVADFCIAALYFEIKEVTPELLNQVQ